MYMHLADSEVPYTTAIWRLQDCAQTTNNLGIALSAALATMQDVCCFHDAAVCQSAVNSMWVSDGAANLQ